MKKRIYTNEEIKELKKCSFILNIKYKREIEYDPIFKLWSIMMRLEFPELSAKDIFIKGGFNMNILNSRLPQRRIKDWLDNYKKYGIKYFLPNYTYYSSIKGISKISNDKSIESQLLYCIINRLKELDNEKS